MSGVMHVRFESSLENLCEANSSFDTAKLKICYTGENRNGSFISKETIEKCMNTIYNCPIVCHYDRETDSIGGHDMEIVSDDDGTIRLVNITTPVGVVPESATPYFETAPDANGVEHEYFCTDVLLWKRQEAYRKIVSDGTVGHSMEINVFDGGTDKESGLYNINDFEFTAFCLLGDGVTPCFEGASVEMYSMSEFKVKMEDMMRDLKESFSLVTASNEEVADIHPQENSMEGGEVLEFEENVLQGQETAEDGHVEFASDAADDSVRQVVDDSAEAFELASNLRSSLHEAVRGMEVIVKWGDEMPRYWYVDHDAEAMLVYAEDEKDYHLYGFSYSMNGDKVEIDVDSRKRMKYAIVEYDEGEDMSPLVPLFELIDERFEANDKAWAEKFQAASDTIDTMTAELSELEVLRKFKSDTEAAAASEAREAVFNEFSDLNGVEAFEALRENCADIEVSDLEEKCYAIRGRQETQMKYSRSSGSPKIRVDRSVNENKPYGDLFDLYGENKSK